MKRRVLALPLSLAALALLVLCGVAQAQWNPCGVAMCTNPKNQYLPVTASDNAGGAIIAWADQRTKTAFGTPRWMIYAQRVNNLGGTVQGERGILLVEGRPGYPEPAIQGGPIPISSSSTSTPAAPRRGPPWMAGSG